MTNETIFFKECSLFLCGFDKADMFANQSLNKVRNLRVNSF